MTQPLLPRDDTYARGLALFERLHGAHSGKDLAQSRETLCPDFLTMTMQWAFAGVLDRPGLDLATRELVVIACCVTLGYALPQLRAHVEAALVAGATREQIVETILQTMFYAGGAAVNNALGVVAEVFAALPDADGFNAPGPQPRNDPAQTR
ncbi:MULTISPECIES: carboxymuconolactone decarboxylase family protein [Burkholderia]|uniref:carboxymuconolactone decarboxylase family protein n=1 Tax=Burkholderia TaxID=32008 RepID=UPI001452ECB8|nr:MULTISPECIES: carboxymuconolactone decarboxylase family protein [Burkholderia]MBN3768921.1 carboxymuconolactone decarboxylase family protein [Burkholderia sp. Se-20378]VWB22499.1 decarboxylase [Burkholderia lata]